MTKQKELMGNSDLDVYSSETLPREEMLQVKSGLYSLLGRLFEEEVDLPLLELLRGELADSLAEAGVILSKDMAEGDPEQVLSALAEEYTGLFVQPGCVSPYRSVFETGRMFQPPCDEASAAYKKAGWEFKHRLSGEFPDHMGVMLTFISKLYSSEADALQKGDVARADEWRDMREKFIVDQIGPWGLGWCQRARLLSQQQFYSSILALAEEVLLEEIKELASSDQFQELVNLNRRPPVKLDYNADFRKASGV
jgi:TorA maturation chaperone TorD